MKLTIQSNLNKEPFINIYGELGKHWYTVNEKQLEALKRFKWCENNQIHMSIQRALFEDEPYTLDTDKMEHFEKVFKHYKGNIYYSLNILFRAIDKYITSVNNGAPPRGYAQISK